MSTKPCSRLQASTTPDEAYRSADFIIIATPTDYREAEESFDTSSVESVVEAAVACGTKAVIVVKSTVPVGFTRGIQAKHPDLTVLFCPEFLREGSAYSDTVSPERIVVGCLASIGNNEEQAESFANLLAACCENKESVPIRVMGFEEAESIKLFANNYLAMRVAFFNELDLYAEEHNLDSKSIIEGVCMDGRIGNFYNNPSFGYGGYCLPKDTRQLLSNYENLPSEMIRATVAANFVRKESIAQHVIAQGTDKKVGIYLLSMKSNSDNYRNSPILDIMNMLREAGMEVIIYDPVLAHDALFNGFAVEQDLSAFNENCDIIIANRYDECLDDVKHKVYTRDIFHQN